MAISEMASCDDQHRCQRNATYVVPLQTYSVDQWVTGCEVIDSESSRSAKLNVRFGGDTGLSDLLAVGPTRTMPLAGYQLSLYISHALRNPVASNPSELARLPRR
jgi:hypothetical protein